MARASGKMENAGHGGARGRRYFSFEYTAFRLLEYMIGNEPRGPFSVYHLMWIEGIRRQRRDRVRQILNQLMERGWVEAVSGDRTRYQVTQKGKIVYTSWVRGYLEFIRSTKLRKHRRPPESRALLQPPADEVSGGAPFPEGG